MLFNCLGWVAYAILIDNLFVFFGNIFALILSVWLNMVALELQYAEFQSAEIRRSICLALGDSSQQGKGLQSSTANPLDVAKIVWDVAVQNTRGPTAHKTIILGLTTIWATLLSIVCFGRSFTPETKELIIGIGVNLNLVFFYGAPLSTILTVVKTRSCSTIHAPTTYTMFLNGFFWAVFGFAVVDWFIAIPNSLGALLAAVQIVLCLVYPRVATTSTGMNGSANGGIVDDDEHIEAGLPADDEKNPEQFNGRARAAPLAIDPADQSNKDS